MSTLTIELADDLKAFVDAEAAENGFPSAAEFLSELIRRERKRKAKHALDAMLLEGLKGPMTPMTREDWESIEREALEGLQGEVIKP